MFLQYILLFWGVGGFMMTVVFQVLLLLVENEQQENIKQTCLHVVTVSLWGHRSF